MTWRTKDKSERSPGFVEQRRHTRIPLQREVLCVFEQRVSSHPSIDISWGGIGLAGLTKATAGQPVTLYIPFKPRGTTAYRMNRIKGEVAWTRANCFGVEFVEPASAMLGGGGAP